MKNLKILREHKNITMEELANHLGLTRSAISLYESGKRQPDFDTLKKLAKYFNVSIDYLLGYSDNPSPNGQILLNEYEIVDIINYPVIGYIKAGFGGEAVEIETGEIQEVPRSVLNGHKPSDFFVLEIRGDSMYPDLRDGDRVLVRKCDCVENGSIAVVLYNGMEATVKRIIFRQSENCVELVPINPMYKPQRIVGPELQEFKVLGLVVYLFRKIK